MNKRIEDSKLHAVNNEEEDDEGGEGGSSGGGFYDPGRQTVAVETIRKFESQFGTVDGGTHSDLSAEDIAAIVEEFGHDLEGPENHPLLENQAYFSGVSDPKERPINEGNLEAEAEFAKQLSKSPKYQEVLRKIAEKKHQKALQKGRSPNPSPF
jgi:hypothetical protein